MKKIIGSMLLSIGLLSAGVISNITQIGDTIEDRTKNTASMTQMDAVGGQPYTMPTSTSTATSETTIDLNLDGGGGGDSSDATIVFSGGGEAFGVSWTRTITGSNQTLCFSDSYLNKSCVTYSPATGLWAMTGLSSASSYSLRTSSDSKSFVFGTTKVTVDLRQKTISLTSVPALIFDDQFYSVTKNANELCFRDTAVGLSSTFVQSCITYRFE